MELYYHHDDDLSQFETEKTIALRPPCTVYVLMCTIYKRISKKYFVDHSLQTIQN